MMAQATATRLSRFGAAAALAGGAATLGGYFSEPRALFTAWLGAFYFWLSMPLGALALLLIWDLTGGGWEPVARLPLSAMAATMPLFILLFLPIIGGMSELYSWTRPATAAALRNGWYLNAAFFFLRAVLYFAIWNGFAAWRLMRPAVPIGRDWLSAIGLILMALSVTFASIDWIMSTEPDWFSSIYGMMRRVWPIHCFALLRPAARSAHRVRRRGELKTTSRTPWRRSRRSC